MHRKYNKQLLCGVNDIAVYTLLIYKMSNQNVENKMLKSLIKCEMILFR